MDEQSRTASNPTIIIQNTSNSSANGGGGNYIYKKKSTALLLCFLFGWLGFHRFYVGKTITGLIYLCSLGLLGVGCAIDFIMILIGSFRDKAGYPLR